MQSIKRSIKSSQPKVRELSALIQGTLATPIASNMDASQLSVVDNGVGDYTIMINNPFNLDVVVSGVAPVTSETIVQILSVAEDRVTVYCFEVDGTTPKDADFYISIKGTDSKILY